MTTESLLLLKSITKYVVKLLYRKICCFQAIFDQQNSWYISTTFSIPSVTFSIKSLLIMIDRLLFLVKQPLFGWSYMDLLLIDINHSKLAVWQCRAQ